MSGASGASRGTLPYAAAQEQRTCPAQGSPGVLAPRLDPIDRWATLYQRARLWKRRACKVAAAAVAGGNHAVIRAALARLRRAREWEAFCRERYLRAVFACYR